MRESNVVCIWQGLGNQMFQYAFAKSMELHTNKRVYIDPEALNEKIIGKEIGSNTVREYGLDYFKISLKRVGKMKRCMWNYTREDKWYYEIIKMLLEKGRYPFKYLDQLIYKDISAVNPTFDELENNTYIKGWFQTENYFADIREVLVKEFQPKKEICVDMTILRVIEETDSVSVHIRRGDYKKGNMMLNPAYYEEAKKIISNKIVNPVWIVFSDDIKYVKDNFCFEGEVYFIDESYALKDYEQLFLMSKCRHNIIANSTFSWWGAWLNQNENKYVIAPTKWFDNQKNIVPKNWIKI